jgi:uncharacterized protein (TIGR03435 family)
LFLLTAAVVLCAQSPPTFEAASIKRSGPQSVGGSDGGPGSHDPGQYSFGRATLLDLIARAYGVAYFQISSAIPLDEQRFDLVAKIPQGATKEQFRVMLQALLAERFHLKVHMTSKEFLAFDLTVAKGGPKFKEAAATAPDHPGLFSQQSFSRGFIVVHLGGQQATMAALAKFLPEPGAPPIGDETGLAGKYDFSLDYTIEKAPPPSAGGHVDAPPAPDLAVALRQQLGLQLIRKKALFDVVVVDSVDKLPTDN